MLKSSFCDYTIHMSQTQEQQQAQTIEKIYKLCSIYCISEINNTKIDNAKDSDIVIPIYNLIKYNDNSSKTSGILWQYHRDEPFLNVNGAIDGFLADNNNSASFRFATKIASRTGNDGTKNVKIRVPWKYIK